MKVEFRPQTCILHLKPKADSLIFASSHLTSTSLFSEGNLIFYLQI